MSMQYLHWWRFDGWHEYLGNCWHFQGHRLSLPPPFSRIFGEGPFKNSTTKFADRLDFAVNKTLSEWVNDGRMGRDLSHFMHNSMDSEIFFSKNDLCSYFIIFASFCLSGNLFLSSLKQTTFTENDRLWCFLLAINIIFMHPSSSLIIDSLLALPLPRV